jgi:predicted RNase H-like nuclease
MAAMYAGVDGCREGWVAVVLPQERVIEGFTHFRPLADHLVQSGVEVIGVDMPLSAPVTGQRACDLLARQALGPFRSSLFITPTAAALAAPTQQEATRINRARGGTGVSSQSFSLRHKVAEVSAHEGPLIEVHPELSFHLLGPVEFRKRSWAGLRERVDVLQRLGLHPLQWECGGWAAADDTLDAAVAAVSARRYARGEAEGFGDHEGMIWA